MKRIVVLVFASMVLLAGAGIGAQDDHTGAVDRIEIETNETTSTHETDVIPPRASPVVVHFCGYEYGDNLTHRVPTRCVIIYENGTTENTTTEP